MPWCGDVLQVIMKKEQYRSILQHRSVDQQARLDELKKAWKLEDVTLKNAKSEQEKFIYPIITVKMSSDKLLFI